MGSNIYSDPTKRHDFIILFDVANGNPNGDPDMDNQPRVDQETNRGLVTDVCLKRKVRNYVGLSQPDSPPNRIYVQDKGIYLNDLHKEAHTTVGIPPEKAKTPDKDKKDAARKLMCETYFDVRMFGAVMSTGINCGQVRGPVQMTFAQSIDPILPSEVMISRLALTDEKEKEKAERAEAEKQGLDTAERIARSGTFGRKYVVPYGLYLGYGFFSAPFAAQTGVTSDDLDLFWSALVNMWDLDRSAARGLMACRGLYIFSHENRLGNAPSHKLFDKLEVGLKSGVETPRSIRDYKVLLNREMPEGITLTTLVGD